MGAFTISGSHKRLYPLSLTKPHPSCLVVLTHGTHQNWGPSHGYLSERLNPLGEQQAKTCAEDLIRYCRQHELLINEEIHTAPSLKAYQTAHILAHEISQGQEHLEVLECEQLSERKLGEATNLSLDEIEQILKLDPRTQSPSRGWEHNSWYKLPFSGAESLMEAGLRVAAHLQKCTEELHFGPKRCQVVIADSNAICHAASCLGLIQSKDIPQRKLAPCAPLFLHRRHRGHWELISGQWS